MPAITDLPPPLNHVFVDFENVHEIDLSVIGAKAVDFTLLLGAKQTKLDAALVEKMMRHASSVQLVRLTSSGKNALDFALAYYVGRSVITDPTGYFHIISRDAGFDPLIKHLRSRRIHAFRHDDFSSLPFAGSAKPPVAPQDDLLTRVVEQLRSNTTARPKKKKTLASHLLAHVGKTSTEADIAALIEALSKARYLSIGDKDAVTYHF